MILLDTTVLVYAVGDDHPLREPCRAVLGAHQEGSIAAATTVEVIQEFVHVRSRRRPRSDAVGLAKRYAAGMPLLAPERTDLELGLDLYGRHSSVGAFDAVLVGVALNHGAEALVSADRTFSTIAELRHLTPDELQAMLA